MTATAIALPQDVQEKIDALTAANYSVDDMMQFIEEYDNDAFILCYELYVELGERYCYEAVDSFIQEFGIDCLVYFEDAYYGQYDSEEAFVEDYIDQTSGAVNIAPWVVIDYTQTWESSLKYDFTFNDGYVFNRNF